MGEMKTTPFEEYLKNLLKKEGYEENDIDNIANRVLNVLKESPHDNPLQKSNKNDLS